MQCTGPVEGNTNDTALLRKRLEYGLADPPDRITNELDALGLVELMSCANQTEIPLIDQIRERYTLILILLRDGDHEPKVRADELVERLFFSTANTLGQAYFLRLVDQRIATDLLEVLIERPFPEGTLREAKLIRPPR
jgi:hypothetical protein